MGNCVGTSVDISLSGLPMMTKIEEELKYDESCLFLARVDYSMFWDKVKLAGYQMKLKPDHIEQISEDINLDLDKIALRAQRNETKEILCDTEFGYKDGLHDPYYMLLLGFMYCSISGNYSQHVTQLWFLINPNFKKMVSCQLVR